MFRYDTHTSRNKVMPEIYTTIWFLWWTGQSRPVHYIQIYILFYVTVKRPQLILEVVAIVVQIIPLTIQWLLILRRKYILLPSSLNIYQMPIKPSYPSQWLKMLLTQIPNVIQPGLNPSLESNWNPILQLEYKELNVSVNYSHIKAVTSALTK